jgi:hypothetical protein
LPRFSVASPVPPNEITVHGGYALLDQISFSFIMDTTMFSREIMVRMRAVLSE